MVVLCSFSLLEGWLWLLLLVRRCFFRKSFESEVPPRGTRKAVDEGAAAVEALLLGAKAERGGGAKDDDDALTKRAPPLPPVATAVAAAAAAAAQTTTDFVAFSLQLQLIVWKKENTK